MNVEETMTGGFSNHLAKVPSGDVRPEDQHIAEETAVAESFCVIDERSANWVVRKINQARAYARHVEVWSAAEIRRASYEEQFFLSRFGTQLETWLRFEVRHRRLKRKSIALPAGTVALRTIGPNLQIIDETAALGWALQHQADAVRTTIVAAGGPGVALLEWCRQHSMDVSADQRVMKAQIVTHFELTGELPDGTAASPCLERLYVR